MAEAINQHLEDLAKELSCSICLGVLDIPVARLPCCHYFCNGCIVESLRHAPKCPVCKTKVTRRDIAKDPTMDRVVTAFCNVQNHQGELEALATGAAAPAPAIPWLQGVDDDDFRSLSRSLSGTALDNLRRANKRGRSKSPATVHKPTTDVAAGGGGGGGGEVNKKKANAKKTGSRKRSDASLSQGVHKFLKKDASGNKTPAPHATTDAAAEEENEECVAESPTMSASLLMGGNIGAAAARQLDDIVAGLDSEEPTPSEHHNAPAAAAAAGGVRAALFGEARQAVGKENKQNGRKTAQKKTATGVGASGSKKAATATAAAKKVVEEQQQQEDQDAPDSSGRRRIPTRLVPWNCSVCTFENKFGEPKCQMCQTVKGAETPPAAQQNFQAVAEASPAAAAAATGLTTGKNAVNRSSKKRTAPGATTTTANQSAPAAEKQQRKMTAAKQTGARGRTALTTTAQKEKSAAVIETTTITNEDASNKAGGSSSSWTGGVSSSKWVLLGSGLDSLGKEQLRSLGALCGATIADKWNPRVTHVICGAGGANAAYPGEKTARRTFKYLMGVLHGRWVLTQEWVNAQLSSKKKVDETAYQVEKDGVGCACGAAASKAAAIAGCGGSKNAAAASHMLLRGFEVQLQGEFANKSQMIELIKAAGGKVVSRLPTTGASTSGITATNKKKSSNKTSSTEVGGVVLVEVPDTSEAVAAGFKAAIVGQTWFSKAVETGVPVASHRWLTDSISTFQLAPLDKFLIGSS